MMKQNSLLIGLMLTVSLLPECSFAQNTTINGATTYQTIHGFGVNINPHSWGVNPESVKNVIDSLILGMGCTSFRLMFDDTDWEQVNDNNDPHSYNWKYYDSVYSAPRFNWIWNTVEYLNARGITDIILCPVGATPRWMGGTRLLPKSELEYAETIASMVHYAKKRRHPAVGFNMISPINETGCWGIEAPEMTSKQLGVIFHDMAGRLISEHITDVSLNGPDDCYNSFNALELLNNKTTMSKVKFLGGHEYGNSTARSEELVYAIKNSDFSDRGVIMTEVNAICDGCNEGNYSSNYGYEEYAGLAYKYVLQHLKAGVNGVQLWEGYDSRWHHHHPTRGLEWGMWGIFAVNDTLRPDVFTRRAHYFVFKQLFRFVKPGFQRIDVFTKLPAMTILASRDPKTGAIVITGINESDKPQTMELELKNAGVKPALAYFYTNASTNYSRGSDVKVTRQAFSQTIPASSVFTFVSH